MTKKTKTVYVHAWEYVNVSLGYPRRHIDGGGHGFGFYRDGLQATAAFRSGVYSQGGDLTGDKPENTADFYFEFEVPLYANTREITKLIDADLIERCATTKVRRVGGNVLTYWKRNKFKMGGAKTPARAVT